MARSDPEATRLYNKKWREEHPEYARNWVASNPTKVRGYHRKWEKANQSRVHEYSLRRFYDLSRAQYDAMLAAQGGHCAICPATTPGGRSKFFHVDHDHGTQAVRGLLCRACNLLLGHARDSVEVLLGAVRYLKRAS